MKTSLKSLVWGTALGLSLNLSFPSLAAATCGHCGVHPPAGPPGLPPGAPPPKPPPEAPRPPLPLHPPIKFGPGDGPTDIPPPPPKDHGMVTAPPIFFLSKEAREAIENYNKLKRMVQERYQREIEKVTKDYAKQIAEAANDEGVARLFYLQELQRNRVTEIEKRRDKELQLYSDMQKDYLDELQTTYNQKYVKSPEEIEEEKEKEKQIMRDKIAEYTNKQDQELKRIAAERTKLEEAVKKNIQMEMQTKTPGYLQRIQGIRDVPEKKYNSDKKAIQQKYDNDIKYYKDYLKRN